MTETAKLQDEKSVPAKKPVTVTAEDGVTFARKEYKKGEIIHCTAEQEKILKAAGVI